MQSAPPGTGNNVTAALTPEPAPAPKQPAPAPASAQTAQAPAPAFKAEKCYGIAKAGKNDCASTGNNSCAGTSKVNADKKAWIYVPEGYCDRIVGGSKTASS